MEQFIIEDRYLTKKIRKSTFKIEGYDGYRSNAFIDNHGRTYFIESMHHNSWALDKLHKLNESFLYSRKRARSEFTKCSNKITRLQSVKSGELPRKADIDNSIIFRLRKSELADPKNYDKITKRCIEIAQYNLKMWEKESKLYNGDTPLQAFNKMHKNIGIDPAEYLVAECGYAAIENGYLIYGNSISYEWTDNNCLVQDFDGNTKFVRPRNTREINKIKAELRNKASYYNSDPSARFHCPSGFIRRDYSEFLQKCRQYGVDYSPRSSRYFT